MVNLLYLIILAAMIAATDSVHPGPAAVSAPRSDQTIAGVPERDQPFNMRPNSPTPVARSTLYQDGANSGADHRAEQCPHGFR